MAASSETSDEGSGWEYGATTAREFAQRRLSEADEPISPAALSRDYGCSGGHMRAVLAELVDEGEARRVGHGQYLPPKEQDSQGVQTAEAPPDAALEAEVGAVGEADEEADDDGDDDAQEGGEETVEVVEETVEEVDAEGMFGDLPPGKMLVASTAVFVVVVLLVVYASKSDEDDGSDETAQQSTQDPEDDAWDLLEGGA